MASKGIIILGSTGTIGVNTLQLINDYEDQFHIVALAAGRNVSLLAEQIKKFKPQVVSVQNESDIPKLTALLGKDSRVEIGHGDAGMTAVATASDGEIVVSAIVGFTGVAPTMAAITAGKDIALANKEAIVAAGPLMMDAVKRHKVALLPVDSEHSAIFQAMHGRLDETLPQLQRIILTASGGPFLHRPKKELPSVTIEEALAHPTWKMGNKITIDSATMMNKGLEVIEATRLFSVEAEKVAVQVHPESIIHSMIEYNDGALLAQLGITDMRGPIAYALAYPNRLAKALPSLNLNDLGKLTFFAPDFEKFPCLKLAFHAAKEGGSMPLALNAANEICVEAFLQKRIGFMDIPRYIGATLEVHKNEEISSLDQVVDLDRCARSSCEKFIEGDG